MDVSMYSKFYLAVKEQGIERAAEYAKRLGFSSVEFFDFASKNWVKTVADVETAKRFRNVLENCGLHTACYSVAVCLYDPDSADGINHDAEQLLMQYAEYAAALGSPFLHHTITLSTDQAPLPYNEMLTTLLPAVVRVAKYAASLGIRCIYEDQGLYFNGVKGFGDFYRAVKAEEPTVGICGDIGNVLFVDESPVDFFREFASEFAHVHLKDYIDCAPDEVGACKTRGGRIIRDTVIGQGFIDTVTCLNLLKESGYTGAIALENSHREDYPTGVRAAMKLITDYINT